MNQRRIDLVNQAFNVLDKNGNGIVDPDDIIGSYDASCHPDVKSGKKTANEVLRELLDTFDVGETETETVLASCMWYLSP